jgi:hypothetical protein
MKKPPLKNIYFESLRKKSNATNEQQLVGYIREMGLFRKIKETPLMINEEDIEKGVLISGTYYCGFYEAKYTLIYNQLKKGMGGLVLSSNNLNETIGVVKNMMESVNRDDLIEINGNDTVKEGECWDFFTNGTSEEIITYLTLFLERTYDINIVEKIKPIVKKFFEYYSNKKIKLTLDNIHEYLDFRQQHLNAIGVSYPLNGTAKKIDRDLTNWVSSEKRIPTELLNTAKALLRESVVEIKNVCNGFSFSEDDLNFKKHILENKVICTSGTYDFNNSIHGEIFKTIILGRYLKALEEIKRDYVPKHDYDKSKSHFILYNSEFYKKTPKEVELIQSFINNKDIYTVYASNYLSGECSNNDITDCLKLLPTRIIMEDKDPSEVIKLFLTSDNIINVRDLRNQKFGEAHVSVNGNVNRIKLAYFQEQNNCKK